MTRPIDQAVEFVEVLQARIQDGWGSPIESRYLGLRVVVEWSKAPAKGDNPAKVDITERQGEGWKFQAFDGEDLVAEDAERHAFGRKLIEAAHDKRRSTIGRDATDQPGAEEENTLDDGAEKATGDDDKAKNKEADKGATNQTVGPSKEQKGAKKAAA
jgi:hypothetical protein